MCFFRFYFTITNVNRPSQATRLSDILPARTSWIFRLWAVLALLGLMTLGCALLQSDRPAPIAAPPGIVFVTATPRPAISLTEGQRSLPLPAVESAPRSYFAEANELGKVMVLQYHRLDYSEQRYQRTPENFRADLQRVYQSGYYPVNFIDLIRGLPDVPPGKKPVVLTFDDSDLSQFRLLDDRTIDADSVVGILLNFHNQHPAEWPTRATFFVLGDDTTNYSSVFGQPEWAAAKIQLLVDLGMEVGSHTVNHADLSVATAERIYWELAVSQRVLEEMAPGYKVQSLAVPFGGFPYTPDFLKSGQWGDFSYSYTGSAAAWGGPSMSPFNEAFDPHRVSRIEVTGDWLDYWLTYFEQKPHEYYVSDGDPERLTFPGVETAAKKME